MLKRYGTSPGGSSRFALTRPSRWLFSGIYVNLLRRFAINQAIVLTEISDRQTPTIVPRLKRSSSAIGPPISDRRGLTR